MTRGTRFIWRLLTLLGVATFFEGYDFNIITVAMGPGGDQPSSRRLSVDRGQAGSASSAGDWAKARAISAIRWSACTGFWTKSKILALLSASLES